MSYSHTIPFNDPADLKTFASGLCMGRFSRQIGQMIWDRIPPKEIKALYKTAEDFGFITAHLAETNPALIAKHTLTSGQEITFPMKVDASMNIEVIQKEPIGEWDYEEECLNEIKGTALDGLDIDAKKKLIADGFKSYKKTIRDLCAHFGDVLKKYYAQFGISAITHIHNGDLRVVGYMNLSPDNPQAIYVNPEFLADWINRESKVEKAAVAVDDTSKIVKAIHNSPAAYRGNSDLIDAIEAYREDVEEMNSKVRMFNEGLVLLEGGDPSELVLESKVQVQIEEPQALPAAAPQETVEDKVVTV